MREREWESDLNLLSAGSVSYTHLDVYKRQEQEQWERHCQYVLITIVPLTVDPPFFCKYYNKNVNSVEARWLYQENFQDRICCCHKSIVAFVAGTFVSQEHVNTGRPRMIRTPQFEEDILNEISEHPEKSTRELVVQFDVDNITVWRVLHEQQLHPYHVPND